MIPSPGSRRSSVSVGISDTAQLRRTPRVGIFEYFGPAHCSNSRGIFFKTQWIWGQLLVVHSATVAFGYGDTCNNP
jgi:hypothetical protein